jgi:hypothetical protein
MATDQSTALTGRKKFNQHLDARISQIYITVRLMELSNFEEHQ